MGSPRSKKNIQVLTGRIEALNCFMSKFVEMPSILQDLKGKPKFRLTPQCQEAFEELKHFLTLPLLLTKPEVNNELYLYIAMMEETIGMVLIREEERNQRPIYFVSQVLQGTEAKYQKLEKLAYAVIISTRKLRHTFKLIPSPS